MERKRVLFPCRGPATGSNWLLTARATMRLAARTDRKVGWPNGMHPFAFPGPRRAQLGGRRRAGPETSKGQARSPVMMTDPSCPAPAPPRRALRRGDLASERPCPAKEPSRRGSCRQVGYFQLAPGPMIRRPQHMTCPTRVRRPGDRTNPLRPQRRFVERLNGTPLCNPVPHARSAP